MPNVEQIVCPTPAINCATKNKIFGTMLPSLASHASLPDFINLNLIFKIEFNLNLPSCRHRNF